MYNLLSKSLLSWACIFGLAIGTVVQVISDRGVLPPSFTAVFSPASDPIPPSLIGDWEDKGDKNYSVTLRLDPDGSYYGVYNTYTSKSIYSQCMTTNSVTNKGSFTINKNEITFHLQTATVENFAGCVWGPMANQTSLPKTYSYSNKYIVNSFSLQNNGQTLEVTQTGGNIKTTNPHEIYQKSHS